ncbi:MAG: helicase-related protein, partial [Planctomycetota bacterium]
LDEIHILDGTPRGDQLRLVLERIDRRDGASEDCPVQRIAASATVSDPHGLAGRYLREAEVIEVGGRREIRARAFDGSAPEELAGHLEELASAGFRKVLIFCNSRKQVEQVASGLRGRTPFGDKVFPHHGSLARALRERTERQVLDAPAAVCVATMTMELGIDIGTVDYVLLAAVPASVSSLLQRMGRGSRRGDQVRVGYACATEGERILYRVLFSRGAAGDLCAAPYAFRPGVLVQQALVISGSRGWVTAEELSAVLPAALREKLPGAAVEEILEAMEEAELIERQGGGRYVLSEGQDRRYQRGVLHSNLESEPQMTVIDRITGDAIGVVGGELEERDLRIGGSARRLAHRDRERLLTDAGRGGDAARFATRGFAGVSLALARRVAEELGAAESRILERRSPEGTILLHGLGTAGAFLLEHCLGMTGRSGKITKVTPYTLRISKEIAELPRPAEADVAAVVSGREKELARSSALGPYHRHLPPKLRTAALRAASGLDLAAEWLQSAGLERHDDEPAPRAWEAV